MCMCDYDDLEHRPKNDDQIDQFCVSLHLRVLITLFPNILRWSIESMRPKLTITMYSYVIRK